MVFDNDFYDRLVRAIRAHISKLLGVPETRVSVSRAPPSKTRSRRATEESSLQVTVLTEGEEEAKKGAEMISDDLQTGSFESGVKGQDGTLASASVQNLESSPTVSSSGSGGNDSSSGSNVPVIAGVVAGVALIALVVIVVVVRKRKSANYSASRTASRRRRSSNINYDNPVYEEASEPATRDNSAASLNVKKRGSADMMYESAGTAQAGPEEPSYDLASPTH